jgi:hypothetical protein
VTLTLAGTSTASTSTASIRCSLTLPTDERPRRRALAKEFFPNVVETGSGLAFSEFFQNERDTGRKGIVVILLKEGVG